MARDFDGSADFGINGNDPVGSYPIAFSAWVEVDDAHIGTIIGVNDETGPGANNNNFQRLVTVNAGPNVSVWVQSDDGGSNKAAKSANITLNTIIHVFGVVRAANDREIYIDGTSSGTNTQTQNYNAAIDQIEIGAHTATPRTIQFFDGKLGFMAIWSADVPVTHIGALARGVPALVIIDQSLKANYPFFGNLSPEPDRSANGFNITLTSAPPKIAGAPVELLENYL